MIVGNTTLIVLVGPQPPMAKLVGAAPTGALPLNGLDFAEIVLGPRDFIGFYDFVRTPEGRIVGLQFILTDAWAQLATLVAGFSKVEVFTSHIFRIVFEDADQVDESASSDQDFGTTRVFIGPLGLAISVDASVLDDAEVASLGGVSSV